MAIHKTSSLLGRQLDCAVALATGRAVRRGRRATVHEIQARKTPFEVFEVLQRLGPASDSKPFFFVRSVTVVSVGEVIGSATDCMVRHIDRDGQERTGSACLFFVDRDEAELERQGQANGFLDGFTPSTCASQVLTLMNSRPVRLASLSGDVKDARYEAEVEGLDGPAACVGPTLEVAFCRAVVEAAFGPEVELPDSV